MSFGYVLKEKEKKENFVETYNHIYYCEVIILPDGRIVQAIPSHQMTLAMLWLEKNSGKTMYDLWRHVPISEDPNLFLCKELNAICIYYQDYVGYKNNFTREQIETINYLYEHGKITFSI